MKGARPMERISVGKTYRVEWDREDFEVVVRGRAIAEYGSWACLRSDNQAPVVLPPEAFKLMNDSCAKIIPPASGPVQG
jgi:hypothetical protein